MIRSSIIISSLLFFPFLASAFPFEIDSTQSQIEFGRLEAVVSDKIIHFTWDVNTEKKGNYFLIEKSTDEVNWNTVKEVKSIKNHVHNHVYRLSQINLAENVYEFFRLIRVDQDGNSSVLDQVNINHPVLNNLLIIPSSKSAHKMYIITYTSLMCCDGKVIIRDENGSTMAKRKTHFDKGYNRIEIDTRNYALGEYEISVKTEFGDVLKKTMKIEKRKMGRTKF